MLSWPIAPAFKPVLPSAHLQHSQLHCHPHRARRRRHCHASCSESPSCLPSGPGSWTIALWSSAVPAGRSHAPPAHRGTAGRRGPGAEGVSDRHWRYSLSSSHNDSTAAAKQHLVSDGSAVGLVCIKQGKPPRLRASAVQPEGRQATAMSSGDRLATQPPSFVCTPPSPCPALPSTHPRCDRGLLARLHQARLLVHGKGHHLALGGCRRNGAKRRRRMRGVSGTASCTAASARRQRAQPAHPPPRCWPPGGTG